MKKTIALFSLLGGAAAGAAVVKNASRKALEDRETLSQKHLALFEMMNQWVSVKQQGKHLADYFEKKQYKSIAIYGMGSVGENLLAELKDSDIQVKYGIDKQADNLYSDIDIVTMNDNLSPVDAVVVTSVFFFEEIKEELSKKVDCPIESLDDILYAM